MNKSTYWLVYRVEENTPELFTKQLPVAETDDELKAQLKEVFEVIPLEEGDVVIGIDVDWEAHRLNLFEVSNGEVEEAYCLAHPEDCVEQEEEDARA